MFVIACLPQYTAVELKGVITNDSTEILYL